MKNTGSPCVIFYTDITGIQNKNNNNNFTFNKKKIILKNITKKKKKKTLKRKKIYLTNLAIFMNQQ